MCFDTVFIIGCDSFCVSSVYACVYASMRAHVYVLCVSSCVPTCMLVPIKTLQTRVTAECT